MSEEGKIKDLTEKLKRGEYRVTEKKGLYNHNENRESHRA